MKKQRVTVNDLMQTGYVYYCTESPGQISNQEFSPELTPRERLGMGVFGGKYMTDCGDEFPKSWFTHARLCHERHDPELNFFGVNASQPLSVWRKKGWIYHEDPRGWFQWYCRYYQGRRCADDERQIKPDQAVESDEEAYLAIKETLPKRGLELPSKTEAGVAELGLR